MSKNKLVKSRITKMLNDKEMTAGEIKDRLYSAKTNKGLPAKRGMPTTNQPNDVVSTIIRQVFVIKLNKQYGGIKMLWTEKYRPSKLSDIAGQEHFVLDAEQWVLENNMPNVLAYGMQGTGKTGAAIALAKSMLRDTFKDNFFEVNASDDRRLETVRTTIKQVAQSGTSLGDASFRIMLLDEMDGMTSDAQNALKRIMERYANNIRFIITCNDKSRIIFPLQSRYADTDSIH